MEVLFGIGMACFALHLIAVALLRWQVSGDEDLSTELFALPFTAHESERYFRMFYLQHCLPWSPMPEMVTDSSLSIRLGFLLARWSAVGLTLSFMSFFISMFVLI